MTGLDGGAPPTLRVVPHLLVGAIGYTLFVVAGLPDVLAARYEVSLAALGLLTSVPLGAFIVAQPVASRLGDRYPTVRVLLWAGVAHGALAVGLDLVSGFSALLALRFVWGLVAGTTLSVGATHIARLAGGGAGTLAQGVYGGVLTLGGAVAFLAGGSVVAATGGFGVHAPGALPAVGAVALCWHHREDGRTAPDDRGGADGAGRSRTAADGEGPVDGGGVSTATTPLAVVTDRTVLLAALVYVAIIGSYVTLSTFVTAFFDDLGVRGPLNAVVLVGATVGRIVGGATVWRFDVDDAALIGWATLAAAVGFGALATGPRRALLLSLPLVTMLAVSLPFGAVYNVAARATAAEGTALATVVGAGNVAALILPPVSGALRETFGSYDGPFAVLAALNLLALGSALALSRSQTDP